MSRPLVFAFFPPTMNEFQYAGIGLGGGGARLFWSKPDDDVEEEEEGGDGNMMMIGIENLWVLMKWTESWSHQIW